MPLPDLSGELVLVTGASGYIASWVVAYALQAGARVRGTVRDPSNASKTSHLTSLPFAAERLELVQLDMVNNTPEQLASVVLGCTLVAHTASPFPSSAPKHEDDLIKPAVLGTTSVLQACVGSATIRKVIVTSSVAATTPKSEGKFGEADWTDVNNTSAYSKSKTLAERAAWALYDKEKPSWSLCTINPCFVLGPTLVNDANGTSTELATRLLSGSMPALPRLSFAIVDVRDVAKAHVLAFGLSNDVAQGRRFIVSGSTYWFKELGQSMKHTFGPMGYSLSTWEAPYWMLWLYAFADASVKLVLPMVNKVTEYDSTPSREVLGLEYTPLDATMRDAGHSLVFHGIVGKKPKYQPPTPEWTPLSSA